MLDFSLQLEFEVVGAGGKDSYIAVDDIFLSAHPCEAQGLYQPQQNEGILDQCGGSSRKKCRKRQHISNGRSVLQFLNQR